MKLLIKSDIDFVLCAFNNKYIYTKDSIFYYGKKFEKFETENRLLLRV